jgi:hypothetical protein
MAKFKKLNNGKIVKSVDEQYLRNDVPCGLNDCPLCDVNATCLLQLNLQNKKASRDVTMHTHEEGGIFVDPSYCHKTIDNRIYIIDHHFALD